MLFRWVAGGKPNPYIQCFTSKGPIYVVDNHGGFWAAIADLKTAGYPYKNAVGRCILSGGNWTNAEHESPLDVIMAEIGEEFNDKRVSSSLAYNTGPFGEYFKIGEQRAHGHEKMGTVRIHDTIFVSEIEMDVIFESLGIPKELQNPKGVEEYLNRISPESARRVFSYAELTDGKISGVPFAWGDGVEFVDATEHVFGFRPRLETQEDGMTVIKLSTSPVTPYASRQDLLDITAKNPLKKKLADGDALQSSTK